MDQVEINNGRALIFLNPKKDATKDEKDQMNRDYALLRNILKARGFKIGFEEEEEAKWNDRNKDQGKNDPRKEITNLSRADIVKRLTKLSEDKDSDGVLVSVIAHGLRLEPNAYSREFIIVKDDEKMCVEDIWRPFLNYEKPKIFLVKACRGKEVNHT